MEWKTAWFWILPTENAKGVKPVGQNVGGHKAALGPPRAHSYVDVGCFEVISHSFNKY